MMYIDEEELTLDISQDLPDPNKNIVKKWRSDSLEIRLIQNGIPLGFNSVMSIPWAIVGIRDGKYIASISIEREDLRIVSHLTSESVKLLAEEYGIRGYLTNPVLVIYRDGEKERVGEINISLKQDDVETYLLEAFLDSFDIPDDEVSVI